MSESVDLTALKEIVDNDQELLAELFDEFISSSSELISALGGQIESDNEGWRKTAHALKGIAVNLGAMPLGELAKIAQESFESDVEVKTKLLTEIKQEHAAVLACLSA